MGDFPAATAAADAMDGSAAARHLRSRGPKPRYSPSAEDQRPQLGGELGPDLLQRQVDKVAANEGDCFFELSLDEVAAKIAAHMRRPEQEILQKAKLLEHCMQRAVRHSTREVVRRQLQRSMQGDGQQEDREDEDDDELESSDEDDGIQLVELKQKLQLLQQPGSDDGEQQERVTWFSRSSETIKWGKVE